jgi:hypothetical protein
MKPDEKKSSSLLKSLAPQKDIVTSAERNRASQPDALTSIKQKVESLIKELEAIEINRNSTARQILADIKPIVDWYVKTENRLP